MSTYFFKTNINSLGGIDSLKPHLEKLEGDNTIDRWHLNAEHPDQILEIETQKLSPEEVKHQLRAAGIEADFTTAPQARKGKRVLETGFN